MKNNIGRKDLFTPSEASLYLKKSITVQTLSNWRCTLNPKGPNWIKIGRRILYKKKDLDLYIEKMSVGPLSK